MLRKNVTLRKVHTGCQTWRIGRSQLTIYIH